MSLLMINEYSSSDDETEEGPLPKKLPKPTLPEFKVCKSVGRPLIDDPIKHQYRIRNFPHEPGNWTSSIFIPCLYDLQLSTDDDSALSHLKSTFKLHAIENPHISLSKVFIIRHHWIETLTETLKYSLNNLTEFYIVLNGLSCYLNEDKTRTFLALNVSFGNEHLNKIVGKIDKSLLEFNLPPFYEEKLFHMSILWGLGDFKTKLDCALHNVSFPENILLKVDHCLFKTGNKIFTYRFLPKL